MMKGEGRKRQLYRHLKAGCTEQAGTPDNYRLFFLLEGKVLLKADGKGGYLLCEKEFILLPAGMDISCLAMNDAGYVVINCIPFKSSGNSSYWEKLKGCTDTKVASVGPMPFREGLGRALGDFASYSVHENDFLSVYDAIFVIMRMLYTPKEMFSLFHPILWQRNEWTD